MAGAIWLGTAGDLHLLRVASANSQQERRASVLLPQELNSPNNPVSLKGVPELQKGTQSSGHLDVSLGYPEWRKNVAASCLDSDLQNCELISGCCLSH